MGTYTVIGKASDPCDKDAYEYDAYGNCNIEDANHESRTNCFDEFFSVFVEPLDFSPNHF